MFEWLLDLIGYQGRGHGLTELARRLDMTVESIGAVTPEYHEFEIVKRSGGVRGIAAPSAELKELQRRVLRRLLARLRVHEAVTGFQRGESFVTNARRHQGRAVIVRFDIRDFFPSITSRRVNRYFRAIGWNRRAARALERLVTWRGRLPQGAPTSPRLSNLVNYRMDHRLAELAKRYAATYTRYADDITISLEDEQHDLHPLINNVIAILRSEGYRPHLGAKFDVRRRHQRQEVTGLVVNYRADLARNTRRWLRAVEHRTRCVEEARDIGYLRTTEQLRPLKRPTISKRQLEGWRALRQMIHRQREATDD